MAAHIQQHDDTKVGLSVRECSNPELDCEDVLDAVQSGLDPGASAAHVAGCPVAGRMVLVAGGALRTVFDVLVAPLTFV